jgi:two-component system cell cycle sensor histidine kinase/response regulator CckA
MSSTPSNTAPRVLVVDDNAAIHQDFRKILSGPASENSPLHDLEATLFEKPKSVIGRVSFRLDSAYQGQEALALVQQAIAANDPYVLVFMDIRMPPGWDGVETIERIWQVCPDLQMVLCSAYSDYTWDDLIRRFGHTDNLLILKKPFETVEVLQIAHALSKKWSLALQARLWMQDLDRLVRERTQELVLANEQLRAEVVERTKVQEALRISEERFSKAFRTSPMPMAIINLSEGRFLDVNDSFFRLTGFSAEELIAHTAAELKLWADYTGRKISALETGRQIHNHNCSLRTCDGTTHEVVLWAEPIALDCGPCALLIIEDISDQLRLETQLRQAQKMEAVGRLAAGVAHEFNNILTVIQGHAELLRDDRITPRQVADSSGRITQASQRAAGLTRQLLTFSRQQPVQLKPLNLSSVVRSTQKMLRQLLGERYDLQLDCAEALPTLMADEGNLEQILINLSINARDAMPNGGIIRIQTNQVNISAADTARNPDARPGHFLSITVNDNGCGISSDVLRRVFDPFFTTKEIGKGTGLGLSTIHGIVRQHQGWIEAASEIGRGSTFTVYLPVATGVAASPTISKRTTTDFTAAGQGETILVVEDDPSVRDLARATLERGGYRVLEAADGQMAIKAWDESLDKIAVLITDMVLPNGMSGGQLADQLQERDPQLRLICISGYGSETLKEDLPENFAPGVNFLSKPFDPHALLKAVKASLDRNETGKSNPPLALI